MGILSPMQYKKAVEQFNSLSRKAQLIKSNFHRETGVPLTALKSYNFVGAERISTLQAAKYRLKYTAAFGNTGIPKNPTNPPR